MMSAVFWIVIGVIIFCALADNGKKRNASSKGRPVRIDHPHYFEADDHECSVCGTRFRGKSMTCPKCGTKFTGTRDDDGEFLEEMVFWDDEDDD